MLQRPLMLRTATCRQAGFLRLRTRLQESARLHRGRGEPFAPQCGSWRGHLLAQKRMRRGSSESTPVRASWRQSSSRRGTVSWSWGGQSRPALHQRQAKVAMVVSSSVFLDIHPMAAALSVLAPLLCLPSVFLCPAAVYHVTPAAARRAFRRVASRRELPLQVVCFLAFAAPVSGSLAFTRGRDRARDRAVLATCVETVGPANAVWTLR